jgi:hypothetical protein
VHYAGIAILMPFTSRIGGTAFAIDLTIADSQVYARPEVWTTLRSNLLDFEQQRLEVISRQAFASRHAQRRVANAELTA